MYRWFIALRYLTGRFIPFAALITVAGGVALLIVILSVMEGFQTELEERIRGTSADLRVESRSLAGLRDPEALVKLVEAVPGVDSALPYVETLAMCRPDPDSQALFFALQARDLLRDPHLPGYLENAVRQSTRGDAIGPASGLLAGQPTDPAELLSPRWLEDGLWRMSGMRKPEPLPPPVLVGFEAMLNFGLTPGRSLRLTSYSPLANRAVEGDFVVAGVFLSRDYVYDSRTLLMPLAAALRFLELEDPLTGRARVSGVRISIAPGEELEAVAERVKRATTEIPFTRVRTWREEKATLLRAVKIEKTVMGIILGVLIIFAGFMIFIVLTVQVVEKTRDLGILQSLGSTSLGIARIYFLVGAGVCLAGTALGAGIGVVFSLSINTIQRWIYLLVGFELFPRNVYYIETIPVRLAPVDLIFIIVPTVLASLVASVIPAWRAARKDPVVALRYE